MKNNPIAWLITHDAYIDRRILFFADVLLENGYSVKLFPSAYTDFTNDHDPDYVVRPLDWTVVKLYGLPVSALLEGERKIMETIIMAQEAYHQNNGNYAYSLDMLPGVGKTSGGYTIHTVGERSGYFISIQKGTRVLVYDSHTGYTTVIADKTVAVQASEYERAIAGANLKTIATDGYVSVGDVAVSYAKGPRGMALAAHCKTADNGVWLFNNTPPELYRGTPIPYGKLELDTMEGREFDYQEYRKIVYDFSPILEEVRRNLKEERPDLVYVADLPTLPIGLMLKETLGCALMVDCHEWWYKQARLWESSMREKIALSEKSEAAFYPQCDICITVGKYLAQDMSACYHKHFDVIYSCMSAGLRLEDTEPEEGFWKTYGIPEGTRVAIFQGSMTDLRNLDNLARATRYLEEDCCLQVVQAVHDQLCGLMEDHKESRDPEPLTIGKGEVRQALAANGVSQAHIQTFEQQYDEAFGADAQLSPRNLVDPKKIEVKTADVTIKVSPDRGDLIETRILNGVKYILVRVEEGVEVNGVPVQITE